MDRKKRDKNGRVCSFCGGTDYYAKGLCRKCYMRNLRNGTLEYKSRDGKKPWLWSENTRKILELHKEGMRQCDIAKEVGLTRQAVSLVIKRRAKETNYDRLQNFTREEMAKFISGKARTFGEEYEGYMSALDWLKEETESESAV